MATAKTAKATAAQADDSAADETTMTTEPAKVSQDVFSALIANIRAIEEDAKRKQGELRNQLMIAATDKVDAIKADLDALVAAGVAPDWYALLGLRKPSVGRAAAANRSGDAAAAATGSGEAGGTTRAPRGTAQGTPKAGLVYRCPDDLKKDDGSDYDDKGTAWQVGSKGVKNPKPEWLAAYLSAGKRWADLPTFSDDAPGVEGPTE